MGTRSATEKANNNFAGIYGGTGGSKPLARILINLLSRLCGILRSCPQALFSEITWAGGFIRQIVHNNQAD